MKKCTSCTKDLPDAALHCVFCGAKQATAPVPMAANNAKTVMGVSSDAMVEQLRAAHAQANPSAPSPFAASTVVADPRAGYAAPAPMQPAGFSTSPAPAAQVPQAQAQAKTMFASGPPPELLAAQQAQQQHQPAPMPVSSSGLAPLAPASSAQAKTMVPEGMLSPFAASTVIEQPMASAPMHRPQEPEQPMSRVHSGGGGFPSMIPPAPVGPVANVQPMFQNNNAQGGGYAMPGQQNPYGAPAPQMMAGRPVEPWAQGLKMMLFIFGALLAVAFVLPWSTDPMTFSWDAIIHGEGLQKLGPLFLGGAALIAIIAAAAPMPNPVRGVVALILGLGGLAIPIVMNHGDLGWQRLVELGGLACLVIGLLIRSEYHDSIMPRILTTLGALGVLSLLVIPVQGEIPFVLLIKSLGMGGGIAGLVSVLLSLAFIALIVCAFFVWLPAPNGGFPKVVMWLVIAWPVIDFLWVIAMTGIGEIKSSPASVLTWLVGGGGGGGGGETFPVAYAVFLAYGGATVFGKSLEA